MRNYIILVLLALPIFLFGQTNSENYLKTSNFQIPTQDGTVGNENDKLESITYYDGLGRPKQQLSTRAGGQQQDIILPIEYDNLGRQVKDYLPYVNQGQSPGESSLAYRLNTAIIDVLPQYYQNKYPSDFENEVNPYNEKLLERSPLSRPLKQGAPGEDWMVNETGDDHTIKFGYLTNTLDVSDADMDNVRSFGVFHPMNNTQQTLLTDQGFYTQGTLYKNTIKDENWSSTQTFEKDHTTEEFKDKNGLVILKRCYNSDNGIGNERHETYYIYDDFGNLTYVLPPTASKEASISPVLLDNLCYQYRYDHRNRLVEKKIPGKGWEYIIYDKLDRPVLTQDANLRSGSKWLFTKYDVFGRVVYTGTFITSDDIEDIKQMVYESSPVYESRTRIAHNYQGTSIYYTADVYPEGDENIEILTVNYYDDYNIGSQITLNPANGSGVWEGMSISTKVKGLPTTSRVRVLGTDDWITSATYYDEKGRAWETHVKNDYLETQDWMLSKLDFVGNVEKTRSMHIKDGTTITTVDDFTYDNVNRLLTHTQKIDNQEQEIIVSNTYDELGQLESKGVGGKISQSRLQEVEYKYNVRGWLKQINNPESLGNDLFSFKINYNTTELGGSNTPLFNGNISETIWRTANDVSNTSQITRGYAYNYDALNRIKKGDYAYRNGTGVFDFMGKYEMGIGSYDQNGNIMSLNREVRKTGYQVDDQYAYQYSGNQLTNIAITDSNNFEETREYSYDGNGNLVFEYREYDGGDNGEEEREINYNHLNLPTLVTIFKEGTDPYGDQGNQIEIDGNITYVYDAVGTKIRKQVDDGDAVYVIDYAGNFIYENDKLTFFSHPEGYIEPSPTGYNYTYQYKDHLGNIRLAYKSNGNIAIHQEDDFTSNTSDWSNPWNGGSITNTNQELNINLLNKWNGTNKAVNITPNEPIHIAFDFDKGSMEKTSLIIKERINGVWESNANRDVFLLQDGHFETHLTLTGDYISIRFEKGNDTDDGTLTTCYVDNFKFNQNNVELLEENNYYPFGLKHKGYNDIVSANANGVASKFKYNGMELEESQGVDWYEMDMRQYDPAIARWTAIDPVTHYSMSPYNAFDNNPVFWADPSGADSQTLDEWAAEKQAEWDALDNGASYSDIWGSGKKLNQSKSNVEPSPKIENNNLVQRLPGGIDFVNTKSKEEKDAFLADVIEWFGFVKKYGSRMNIHPGSVINFYAMPNEKNKETGGEKLADILGDMAGGNSADSNNYVVLTEGKNSVRIGYWEHTKNFPNLYSASVIDFQDDIDEANKTFRISIRANARENGPGHAIIYMYFTGENKDLYNKIEKEINAYKYKSAKMIPYKKQ